jgi:AcrR family transcriptional regulator
MAMDHQFQAVFGQVPNPCEPLADYFRDGDAAPGGRWRAQRMRRSRIFAATRMLMTRQVGEQVHLHDVAAECGISVQTIYNLVGNRAEILGGSAEEWVGAIGEVAREQAEGSSAIFAALAMYWSAAIAGSEYVRSAVRLTSVRPSPLQQRFCRAATRFFYEELTQLGRNGSLRGVVEPKSLARQLALLANSTISAWTAEPYPVEAFASELVNGPGLLLCGAVRNEELQRLEQAIARLAA